tara:strand:+ start:117 stop:305 length:189 start_codon:yes stop_codon:yes gene_type:complete
MKWTDKRVKEFVKVATSGSYGDYFDCSSLDRKMRRFKQIKRRKDINYGNGCIWKKSKTEQNH